MYTYNFEKLTVWQLSRSFTLEIYTITKKFPDDEKFGLTSQVRRASVSVCSNIAEGSTRNSTKDKGRFYRIAYGSIIEVLNQLIIASDLEYINTNTLNKLRSQIEEITNKLNALHNSLNK